MMRRFEEEEAKENNQDIRAKEDEGDNQRRENAVQDGEQKDESVWRKKKEQW